MDVGMSDSGCGNVQQWMWECPTVDVGMSNSGCWNVQQWMLECSTVDVGMSDSGCGNVRQWMSECPTVDVRKFDSGLLRCHLKRQCGDWTAYVNRRCRTPYVPGVPRHGHGQKSPLQLTFEVREGVAMEKPR